MIKNINTISYFKRIILESSKDVLRKIILLFDKFYYARKQFRQEFGRKMDLRNPQNLIEKFYWLEAYSDLSLMTKCADKYAVREFIKERGCHELLNELYAKWDNYEDIDFSSLPDKFILKINNGSGDVTIVTDKNKVNILDIKKHFEQLYKKTYGKLNGQLHYTKIKPCIIAEKLLPLENIPYSCSIIDYKIWCFDGKADCIFVAYNRHNDFIYMDLFDTEWNSLAQYLKPSNHYQYHPEIKISKPTSLKEMVRYAEILSKGFPEARIDFYEVSGRPLFGEITFTSGYGYFTHDFYNYLGSKTNLHLSTKCSAKQ